MPYLLPQMREENAHTKQSLGNLNNVILEQVSVSVADYVGIAVRDRNGACLVQPAIPTSIA